MGWFFPPPFATPVFHHPKIAALRIQGILHWQLHPTHTFSPAAGSMVRSWFLPAVVTAKDLVASHMYTP